MGKGDKRSKRGKIKSGTYGNTRMKSDNKKTAEVTEEPKSKPAAKKKTATKKAAAKK